MSRRLRILRFTLLCCAAMANPVFAQQPAQAPAKPAAKPAESTLADRYPVRGLKGAVGTQLDQLTLLGGDSGHLKGGRHLVQEKGTPMGNLLLALAQRGGVEAQRFGDTLGSFLLVVHAVNNQRLRDGRTDGHLRVQRREGVLEDNLHALAQLAHLRGRAGEDVASLDLDLAGARLEQAQDDAYGNPDNVVSAVIGPRGSAVKVDGGYRLSGFWPFASGNAGNSTGYPGFLYSSEGRFVYLSVSRKF